MQMGNTEYLPPYVQQRDSVDREPSLLYTGCPVRVLRECDSHNMWITIFTVQKPKNSDRTAYIWLPCQLKVNRI